MIAKMDIKANCIDVDKPLFQTRFHFYIRVHVYYCCILSKKGVLGLNVLFMMVLCFPLFVVVKLFFVYKKQQKKNCNCKKYNENLNDI